jgi:hypothetical protein
MPHQQPGPQPIPAHSSPPRHAQVPSTAPVFATPYAKAFDPDPYVDFG